MGATRLASVLLKVKTMARTLRNRDWLELAQKVGWSSSALAKKAGVSLRTLERCFHLEMGQCPQCWLNAERLRLAREWLMDGSLVKEVAARLGFKTPEHFARLFKQQHGHPPSRHAVQVPSVHQNPICRH